MAMAAGSPRDRRILSEINVTPLVDVMLVLLIIFMVTTPLLQRGTDVELPQAATAEVKESERLTLTLNLTMGGNEHRIPGGNVRAVSLAMTSWGVEGTVELWMQAEDALQGKYRDDLLDDFLKPELQPDVVKMDIEGAEAPALDGMTRLLADREKRQSLKCIRCGACMNTCPVYRRSGGGVGR